mmetsp:Transcript_766/g.1218  ORF Transcript_766/g.1218 Transcript_766/m.1218 type:complete len:628 (-) Transcript_766:7-1890(-)
MQPIPIEASHQILKGWVYLAGTVNEEEEKRLEVDASGRGLGIFKSDVAALSLLKKPIDDILVHCFIHDFLLLRGHVVVVKTVIGTRSRRWVFQVWALEQTFQFLKCSMFSQSLFIILTHALPAISTLHQLVIFSISLELFFNLLEHFRDFQDFRLHNLLQLLHIFIVLGVLGKGIGKHCADHEGSRFGRLVHLPGRSNLSVAIRLGFQYLIQNLPQALHHSFRRVVSGIIRDGLCPCFSVHRYRIAEFHPIFGEHFLHKSLQIFVGRARLIIRADLLGFGKCFLEAIILRLLRICNAFVLLWRWFRCLWRCCCCCCFCLSGYGLSRCCGSIGLGQSFCNCRGSRVVPSSLSPSFHLEGWALHKHFRILVEVAENVFFTRLQSVANRCASGFGSFAVVCVRLVELGVRGLCITDSNVIGVCRLLCHRPRRGDPVLIEVGARECALSRRRFILRSRCISPDGECLSRCEHFSIRIVVPHQILACHRMAYSSFAFLGSGCIFIRDVVCIGAPVIAYGDVVRSGYRRSGEVPLNGHTCLRIDAIEFHLRLRCRLTLSFLNVVSFGLLRSGFFLSCTLTRSLLCRIIAFLLSIIGRRGCWEAIRSGILIAFRVVFALLCWRGARSRSPIFFS